MSAFRDSLAQVETSADSAIGRAQSEFMNLAEHLRGLQAQADQGDSQEDKDALSRLREKIDALDIGGEGKKALERMGEAFEPHAQARAEGGKAPQHASRPGPEKKAAHEVNPQTPQPPHRG